MAPASELLATINMLPCNLASTMTDPAWAIERPVPGATGNTTSGHSDAAPTGVVDPISMIVSFGMLAALDGGIEPRLVIGLLGPGADRGGPPTPAHGWMIRNAAAI
ncbi:hypothetical protein, partial [Arthrobacter sp. Hiyo1]|uniref:hypothetical protein n=1 Tax=Arthrobacter sp. Hiyo1 TaxID=1588020 RepID=UPI001C0EB9FC